MGKNLEISEESVLGKEGWKHSMKLRKFGWHSKENWEDSTGKLWRRKTEVCHQWVTTKVLLHDRCSVLKVGVTSQMLLV